MPHSTASGLNFAERNLKQLSACSHSLLKQYAQLGVIKLSTKLLSLRFCSISQFSIVFGNGTEIVSSLCCKVTNNMFIMQEKHPLIYEFSL